jgi:hypothetical protein
MGNKIRRCRKTRPASGGGYTGKEGGFESLGFGFPAGKIGGIVEVFPEVCPMLRGLG